MDLSGLPHWSLKVPLPPIFLGFGGRGSGASMHRRSLTVLSIAVLALLVFLMLWRGDAGWKGQETATFPPATDLPRAATKGLAHPGLP